jgi:hypothetical protein
MKRQLAVVLLGLLSTLGIASAKEPRHHNGRNRCDSYREIQDRRDRRDWRESRLYSNGRHDQSYRAGRHRYERRRDNTRSTAASVGIIAGSAGAGAAIGGIAAGGKGAAVGAIAGGIAGTIYDQATRDGDDRRRRR